MRHFFFKTVRLEFKVVEMLIKLLRLIKPVDRIYVEKTIVETNDR